MTNRPFDLIIFGVTGYTGTYCLRNFFKIQKNLSKNYRLAVAGRSVNKVKDVLQQVGQEINRDLVEEIKIFQADCSNFDSLLNMTSQCKVLINTVGPFLEYGPPVIKACIETETHHVDIAGEPIYFDHILNELDEKAQKKNVYIVPACGYDSIPSDCGSMYLKNQFPNIRFNQVESFLKIEGEKVYNHATFDSLMDTLVNFSLLNQLFFKIEDKKYPRSYQHKYKLKLKTFPQRDTIWKNLFIPFWPLDKYMVYRSQMQLYQEDPTDFPMQMFPYFCVSLCMYITVILYTPILLLFCLIKPIKKFVLNHPKIFTFGLFTQNGPTAEQVRNSSFQQYLLAKGWHKDTLNGSEPTVEPNVTKTLLIKAPELGYDATSILVMVAGITVLEDLDKNSNVKPGVISPGYAFRKTKIFERLRLNNITFDIIGH